MITTAKLAGFFAAHAIWCVSDFTGDDDGGLIPMLAHHGADGERAMARLAFDDMGKAIEHGRKQLGANAMDANDAVFIYDGRITLPTGKIDAIILEMRCYAFPDAEAVIAVPYTPQSKGGFRVHKPKVVVWNHCEDFDRDAAFDAFFEGVDEHEKGAEVWNASLDQSI